MIRFDSLNPAMKEALCTPMHLILPVSHSHSPTPIRRALYLGSIHASTDTALLREHGITHLVQVLNVPWCPRDPPGFTSLRIDIHDAEAAADQLRDALDGAVRWMRDALESEGRSGGNVLVHCQQGISRSASIVIAYLIRHHAMRYDDALAYICARRACAKPNRGFERVLREWEARWCGAAGPKDHVGGGMGASAGAGGSGRTHAGSGGCASAGVTSGRPASEMKLVLPERRRRQVASSSSGSVPGTGMGMGWSSAPGTRTGTPSGTPGVGLTPRATGMAKTASLPPRTGGPSLSALSASASGLGSAALPRPHAHSHSTQAASQAASPIQHPDPSPAHAAARPSLAGPPSFLASAGRGDAETSSPTSLLRTPLSPSSPPYRGVNPSSANMSIAAGPHDRERDRERTSYFSLPPSHAPRRTPSSSLSSALPVPATATAPGTRGNAVPPPNRTTTTSASFGSEKSETVLGLESGMAGMGLHMPPPSAGRRAVVR